MAYPILTVLLIVCRYFVRVLDDDLMANLQSELKRIVNMLKH